MTWRRAALTYALVAGLTYCATGFALNAILGRFVRPPAFAYIPADLSLLLVMIFWGVRGRRR